MSITFNQLNRIDKLNHHASPDELSFLAWILKQAEQFDVPADARVADLPDEVVDMWRTWNRLTPTRYNLRKVHNGWRVGTTLWGFVRGPNGFKLVSLRSRRSIPGAALTIFDSDQYLQLSFAEVIGHDPERLDLTREGDDKVTVSVGNEEYVIYRDEDAAIADAVAQVTKSLKKNPEYFNQDFIRSHINEDKFRREAYAISLKLHEESVKEMADDPDDFWRTAVDHSLPAALALSDEVFESGEFPDPEPHVEALAELIAHSDAENPWQYMREIYGEADLWKWIMENVGIDVESAAKEAVRTDGWAHMVARYDGVPHTERDGYAWGRTD